MVGAHDRRNLLKRPELETDLSAQGWVRLHNFEFLGGQRAIFLDNFGCNRDLASVVKKSCQIELPELSFREADQLAKIQRIKAGPLDMALEIGLYLCHPIHEGLQPL